MDKEWKRELDNEFLQFLYWLNNLLKSAPESLSEGKYMEAFNDLFGLMTQINIKNILTLNISHLLFHILCGTVNRNTNG